MPGGLQLGRILVVDDESAVRDMLSKMLTVLGYEVETADGGAMAIDKLGEQHFDLVITDLNMPGVGGDDLLATIREAELDTDVLMMSGVGSIALAVEAMKHGARSFLEKPFTMAVLKKEVRAIFQARAKQRGRHSSSPPSDRELSLAATAEGRIMLGPYEIRRQIGAGGMGRVYEGYDPRLKRTVAVKTMLPERDPKLRAEFIDRFKREGWVTGQLSHPNIVAVYDFGEATTYDLLYLVMELVRGPSLRQKLDEVGRLPVDQMLRVAIQVAAALKYAHEQGIIHRDVKPENILLAKGDQVKLVDFGIAKVPSSDLTGDRWVGSPAYFSPEVVKGREVDFRADQFALGTVMIEMLCGKCIFAGSNIYEIIQQVADERTPKLKFLGIEVDADIERIIMRLHRKDPMERFLDERELLDSLSDASSRLAAAG